MFYAISAVIAVLGSAATVPAAEPQEPNPKTMSQSEIRAFNATLEKDHKFFIRCKKSAATGSFIERQFTCRTNEQWAEADVRGNDIARDIGERMASKAASGN